MSLTVKVDPIDRDIELMLAEELGPAARSQALAEFARTQLAEAQATNAAALGAVPPHETFVDGRQGAAVETVKPDGTIVFEFEIVNDVLEWIGEQLVKHSPVLTGAYARSHILLADDVEVPVPGAIPEAKVYAFVNTQPYARKIERGLSDQAAEGVYEAVALLAKRRFGNIARISFSFRAIDVAGGAGPKPGRERRKRSTVERQPAIIVAT